MTRYAILSEEPFMSTLEFSTFVDLMKPILYESNNSDPFELQPANTPSSWLLLLLLAEIKSEIQWRQSLSMLRYRYRHGEHQLFRLVKPEGELILERDFVELAQQLGYCLGHLELSCLFRWFGVQLFQPITLRRWIDRFRLETTKSDLIPLEKDSRTLTAMQTVERAWSKYLDDSKVILGTSQSQRTFEREDPISVSFIPAEADRHLKEDQADSCIDEQAQSKRRASADTTFEARYFPVPENHVFEDSFISHQDPDSIVNIDTDSLPKKLDLELSSSISISDPCDFCKKCSKNLTDSENAYNDENPKGSHRLRLDCGEDSDDWLPTESVFSFDKEFLRFEQQGISALSDSEALLEFLRLQIITLRNNIKLKKILSERSEFSVMSMYKLLQNGNEDLPCAHSILNFLQQWIPNVDMNEVQLLIVTITRGKSNSIDLSQLYKFFERVDDSGCGVLEPIFVASFLRSLFISSIACERIKATISLRNTLLMILFEHLIDTEGAISFDSLLRFASKIATEEDIVLLLKEFGHSDRIHYSEFCAWVIPCSNAR